MKLGELKAVFKSIFNTPDEEIERRIRESDSEEDMCISKGITENICLFTWQKGFEYSRVKEESAEAAAVYYVSGEGEEWCGELPMEQAVHLAKRIRVLANIDGWGHSDITPYQMLLEGEEHSFHLTVTHFQLKPKLNVLWKVEHVSTN